MDFKSDTYPTPKYTDLQAKRIMECLDTLAATIEKGKFCCASCGLQLPGSHANIYDHDGGWGLIGDIPKQWISFECKCGYHTSLNKMQSGLSKLLYKDSMK